MPERPPERPLFPQPEPIPQAILGALPKDRRDVLLESVLEIRELLCKEPWYGGVTVRPAVVEPNAHDPGAQIIVYTTRGLPNGSSVPNNWRGFPVRPQYYDSERTPVIPP